MFPFTNRFWWHVRNRQLHLIEVTQGHLDMFPQPYRAVLSLRARSMKRWLKVRAVLFAILYFGLIASGVGLLLDYTGSTAVLDQTLSLFNRIAGAFAGVTTVTLLLVMRFIGQLEADLVGCMAVGTLPSSEDKDSA